jgi:hypothetical protein
VSSHRLENIDLIVAEPVSLHAEMSNQRLIASVIIGLIGLVILVIGVIYLTVEAKSLPSVLGQLHGVTVHRTLRGWVALIIGVVLVLVAGGLYVSRPREPA